MYEKLMGTCKNEDDDKMKERALAFATLITIPAKKSVHHQKLGGEREEGSVPCYKFWCEIAVTLCVEIWLNIFAISAPHFSSSNFAPDPAAECEEFTGQKQLTHVHSKYKKIEPKCRDT